MDHTEKKSLTSSSILLCTDIYMMSRV